MKMLPIFLVIFLASCSSIRSPTLDEAEYREQFTPAIHVESLIDEGRYEEALQLALNVQDSLWVDSEKASLLYNYIEANTDIPVAKELFSLVDNSPTTDRATWEIRKKQFRHARAFIELARRVSDSESLEWYRDFSINYQQSKDAWLEYLKDGRAGCDNEQIISCLEEYPVDVASMRGNDRIDAVSRILDEISYGNNSVIALKNYLEMSEEIIGYAFESKGRRLPLLPLQWITVDGFPDQKILPSIAENISSSERINITDVELKNTRFSLFGVILSDKATVSVASQKAVQSEYLSSRQERSNPDYQRLLIDLNNARYHAQSARQALASAPAGFAAGFARGQVIGAEAKANRFYNQLSATPATIAENIFSPYSYTVENYLVKRDIQWRVYVVDKELEEIWGATVVKNIPVTFPMYRGVDENDRSFRETVLTPSQAVRNVYAAHLSLSLKETFENPRAFTRIPGYTIATEVDGLFSNISDGDFVYASAQDFNLTNGRLAGSAIKLNSSFVYGDEEYWLASVSRNGGVLTLNDGSVWEVSAIDRIYSRIWLRTSRILVVDSAYGPVLVNADDGEKVSAVFLGRR